MNSGSIQIFDPEHYYSRIFTIGTPLDVSFGYAKKDLSPDFLLSKKENPNEMTGIGGGSRTGIKAYVTSPNGTGAANGVITFNINFFGREYLSKKQKRVFTGMSKGTLVRQLLTEIGCTFSEVKFTRENEVLNQNTQIFQRETNYKLLLRFAREWRGLFRISFNSAGQMVGLFISPGMIDLKTYPLQFSGAIAGNSIYLDYKGKVKNVISYSWKNQAGDGGSGDNVRMVMGANGKPTFLRYVTKGDTVKVYQLRPERIKNVLKKAGDFTKRIALLKEWVGTSDFNKVKQFFDPVDMPTAPQGLGYSLNIDMLGNPFMSPPLKVLFGDGFPTWFQPREKIKSSNFYARKVTHTIDRSGYKMKLDVADAFTINGGSLL